MVNLRENKVFCSCGARMNRWLSRRLNLATGRKRFYNSLGCSRRSSCGRIVLDEDPLPSDLTVIPSRKWIGVRAQ